MTRVLWVVAAAALNAALAAGAVAEPLVPHRAAYDVTLTEPFAQIGSGQTQSAVGARGLIGYEFQGSACEGYTSKFRLAAQIEQSESDPISLAQRSLTFEEPNSAGFRFNIEDKSGDDASTVSGYATRGDAGAMAVDLKKPTAGHADLGKDILFPTEHIAHLLTEAEAGHTRMEARVYDGSDSGKKVYQTLSIIGKKEAADGSAAAKLLAGHSRWPVTISYFDASTKDSGVEYVMAFDLYDNGVTGDLKIDYGTFAIAGKLASLEFLPQGACKK